MKRENEHYYWNCYVWKVFEDRMMVLKFLERKGLVLGTTGKSLGTTPEQFEDLSELFFEGENEG